MGVEGAIALLNQKRQKKQRLKNPAGFLVKAIENQWQPKVEPVSSPEHHPAISGPTAVNPADLRVQYEAIEREKDTPEYQAKKDRVRKEIDRIKSQIAARKTRKFFSTS